MDEQHLVSGLEIGGGDFHQLRRGDALGAMAANRFQRGLVAQQSQVGTIPTRGLFRPMRLFHFFQWSIAIMQSQNRRPTRQIGQIHLHLQV